MCNVQLSQRHWDVFWVGFDLILRRPVFRGMLVQLSWFFLPTQSTKGSGVEMGYTDLHRSDLHSTCHEQFVCFVVVYNELEIWSNSGKATLNKAEGWSQAVHVHLYFVVASIQANYSQYFLEKLIQSAMLAKESDCVNCKSNWLSLHGTLN